jgi:hypothetical protein
MIIVGVADNVSRLIENHLSIQRCSEEILMPRMDKKELLDVLAVRLQQLDFSIDGDAKWKIINLAKGLPAFIHALGKHACFNALNSGNRLHIYETDVDGAINALIASFAKDKLVSESLGKWTVTRKGRNAAPEWTPMNVDRGCGRVRLRPPLWETTMQTVAYRPEAPNPTLSWRACNDALPCSPIRCR